MYISECTSSKTTASCTGDYGYLRIIPLNKMHSCKLCNEECGSCDQNNFCFVCIDPNPFPNTLPKADALVTRILGNRAYKRY